MSVNGIFVHQGDTINVCRQSSVTYASFGTVTSTNWQFHLGTPATSAVPAPPPIQYNTNGIDSTILTITDATGTTTMSIIIRVTDIKPVVDFTFNNNACSGTAVQFNSNVSSGTPPYTYAWAFGDGGTSTSPNPSHTYTSLGCSTANFNATLTVTDATGCSSTVVTHAVTVKQAPDVQIKDASAGIPFSNCQNSPTPGNPNYTLTVNNISPSAGCINSYNINWGDGTPVQTNVSFPLTHTYTQIGAFNLVVTAIAANGCDNSKTYIVANQTNPAGSLGTLGSTTNLCAPATVPFTISNWQINSVGTVYTLNFGDGQQIVLNHPLNPGLTTDTIYHTYTTTSCPALSFTATLTVTNACGSTPYTAGNIQVRIKPTASFTATPNPACTGQSVCFTNTSVPGGNFDCTTAPTGAWDFGDGTPISNATSPCHTYAAAGTYTVTLTMTNFCGSSVATKQVCITAPPVPGFTIDNAAGCIPLNVAATNTTVDAATCGAATYLWSVSYVAGFCGASSSFSFTNGTTNVSVNPSFVFNNPGTYTITLRVTNTCGSFTTTQTVIVKKPPTVSINAISNFCGTGSISPVAVVSACTPNTPTYLWTFQGGTPATSTSLNPGAVSFSGAGVHTVSLDVTNECGTVSASRQFTIDTVTVADAGPGQNMCGTTATMAGNAPVIGNGLWTKVSGVGGSITTPTSPTTTVTGLTAGTYVFRWTITSGTCTSSSTVTIIISAGATPAAAGPDQSLCLATSATLAANTPTVGTGAWSYVSGPAGYTITNPALPNTTVTGLVPGVYIFRWTTSFSTCTPSTDDVQISIFDNPTASDAGTDQTICASTATMAGNTALIGAGLWSFVSGPNTPVITAASSPTTTITGLIPGTYVFRWRISNGACPPSDDNVQVIVTVIATTAAAGPDQIVCAATSVTLAGNTAVIGTGTWTYVSGPAGYTITSPSSANTTVTGLVPGTYVFRWTISNGVCPATSDDVQIIINANVTVADAGPSQNMCGTTATMAGNVPVVGNGLWSLVGGPNTPTITTPASPSTTITGLIPGTYTFKWTITNGSCISSSNVIIIIAAGATNAAAGADQNLCLATNTTLNGNTAVIGTGAWSNVSGPNTPTITAPGSPTTTVTGLVPGVYIFRWTISFSTCTPTTDDVQVTVFDNPTVAAAGNDQTICSAAATMAGNTATIGSGVWTRVSGPNTPTITTPSSPVTTITGLVPGTYVFKWKISNGACPPSEDDVQIIVTAVATTAAAGTDQVLCASTNTTLAGNTAVVGTGLWTNVSGPNTPTITTPASPSSAVTGLIPGTYVFRWTITNGVCPPSTDDVQVTVLNALQNQVSAAITTICSGQSVTIAGGNPTGGTGTYSYGWEQSPDGISNWTAVPLGNGQSLTITLTTTTYFRRKVSSLPCETYSNIIMITVQASVANNNISANQSICIQVHCNRYYGRIICLWPAAQGCTHCSPVLRGLC